MLKGLLSPSSCASCRVCCVFDREDCWEMPLIKPELAKLIEKDYPEVKIKKTGVCGVFEPDFGGDGLPKERGSLPLLTLSPVCETVSKLPVSEISEFAKKLSDKVFEEAQNNPEMIKDYIDGYPIFAVK